MKNKILNRFKKLIPGLGLLLLCLSLFSLKSAASIKKDTIATSFKLKTIIIDAGHGVKADGAPAGHYSRGADGTFSSERNVTLAIALKLQKAIEKELAEVKAVLTRSTPDDVSWERRAQIANENKGQLFISLHCNSLADRVVRERIGTKKKKPVYRSVRVANRSGKGVLLLIYGLHRSREEEKAIQNNQVEDDAELNSEALDPDDPTVIILTNEYKRKFRKQSVSIANFINDEFVQNDGRRTEGLREQGLYLLCHSAMPSVLIETGYINNIEEEQYLNSEDGQNEIVDSIVRAIKNYKNQMELTITN
ncbi:N-acetylmuramoyl-L-alanine amidase family protein [Mucilaginibacter psychrotolerans]|uniref:N-acetylmuramoyl-L-alanine amidase n=1 Tax=Mucilaginibacter psychrotolerans TaxID=1524096 RepID=A0A4Y8SM20_9SPHI|nr:N-acetylmuramoyl-L-alanine amidase [Mucilaginibacter psychrotolerans]TFF39597.1 N-acetylmuramoyl-L-alanine amidase [Mucilaginibacter psychrotolerans]